MNDVDPNQLSEAYIFLTRTHALAAELTGNTYTSIAAEQLRAIADQLNTYLKKIKYEGYTGN